MIYHFAYQVMISDNGLFLSEVEMTDDQQWQKDFS